MGDNDEFQVLPPLRWDEYQALKESIREHGVQLPVVCDGDGRTVDGLHRIRAVRELRDEGCQVPRVPTIVQSDLKTDADRRARARALNLQRRQLTQQQKRDVIRDQLRETPWWADRRIAQHLGVDDHTVRSRRLELEETAEIPQFEKLVGLDGIERPRRAGSAARLDLLPSLSQFKRHLGCLFCRHYQRAQGRERKVRYWCGFFNRSYEVGLEQDIGSACSQWELDEQKTDYQLALIKEMGVRDDALRAIQQRFDDDAPTNGDLLKYGGGEVTPEMEETRRKHAAKQKAEQQAQNAWHRIGDLFWKRISQADPAVAAQEASALFASAGQKEWVVTREIRTARQSAAWLQEYAQALEDLFVSGYLDDLEGR